MPPIVMRGPAPDPLSHLPGHVAIGASNWWSAAPGAKSVIILMHAVQQPKQLGIAGFVGATLLIDFAKLFAVRWSSVPIPLRVVVPQRQRRGVKKSDVAGCANRLPLAFNLPNCLFDAWVIASTVP